MTDQSEKKSCFVSAPIGPEGSEIRERSNIVRDYVIKPVAEECGYEAIRADEIDEPGMITTQVIQHLLDDDLIVADLTGHNPNVFYELAVRHAVKKPIVQLIQAGEDIPFDISIMRTVQLDITDPRSVDQCKKTLVEQIKRTEAEPDKLTTPISHAIDLKLLAGSGDPADKMNAEIISMLQDIKTQISKLQLSVAKDADKRDFLRRDRERMTATEAVYRRLKEQEAALDNLIRSDKTQKILEEIRKESKDDILLDEESSD